MFEPRALLASIVCGALLRCAGIAVIDDEHGAQTRDPSSCGSDEDCCLIACNYRLQNQACPEDPSSECECDQLRNLSLSSECRAALGDLWRCIATDLPETWHCADMESGIACGPCDDILAAGTEACFPGWAWCVNGDGR